VAATTQGVWALAVYRFGRWVYTRAPRPARLPLKVAYHVAQKAVESTTGIQIPASCDIGPGLYIGHFGTIVVHGDVRMGRGCSLSQDTTVGSAGVGKAGAPRLGDGVYVAAGARVLGPVRVGDRAVVGANAVVIRDVPDDATAVGVPARVLASSRRER
jgi:serine O-acetyltransferase